MLCGSKVGRHGGSNRKFVGIQAGRDDGSVIFSLIFPRIIFGRLMNNHDNWNTKRNDYQSRIDKLLSDFIVYHQPHSINI